MNGKTRFSHRLIAFVLTLVMVVSLIPASLMVSADAGVEDPSTNPNAMHFIIRHWHAALEDDTTVRDVVSGEVLNDNFSVVEGYIVPGDADGEFDFYLIDQDVKASGEGGQDWVQLTPAAWESWEDGAEVAGIDKGYISSVDFENGEIVLNVNPYTAEDGTELEGFSGFSVSAGHAAIDADSDEGTITVSYSKYVHLVKSHIFYRDKNATVNGNYDLFLELDDPQQDTMYIYVDKTTGDPIRDEDGNLCFVADGLPEGYEADEAAEVKYYSELEGLHTDKTAHAWADGRTFDLDLEAWYSTNAVANVGMILDASGSMGFTSEALELINIHDLHARGLLTDAQYDTLKGMMLTSDAVSEDGGDNWENYFLASEYLAYILNTRNTDNSALSYSGYSYYIYDARSSVNEYVPLGYWNGTIKTTDYTSYLVPQRDDLTGYYAFNKYPCGDSAVRDWLLNSITGTCVKDDGSEQAKKIAQASSVDEFDFNEIAIENWPTDSLQMDESYGFKLVASDQKTTDRGAAAVLIEPALTGSRFTISFVIRSDAFTTTGKGPENEAQIMYIGNGNSEDGYLALYRDVYNAETGSNSSNRLKGRTANGSVRVNLNNVFNGVKESTDTIITIVYDNGKLTSYAYTSDGNVQTSSYTDVVLPTEDLKIVLNGLYDEYDGGEIYIDDLYVFNTSLTASEVEILYTNVQSGRLDLADGKNNNGAEVKVPIDDTKTTNIYVAVDSNDTVIASININYINTADGTFKGTAGAEGWYYVNSTSTWYDYYNNENVGTAKFFFGIPYVDAAKDADWAHVFIDCIEGLPAGVEAVEGYPVTSGTSTKTESDEGDVTYGGMPAYVPASWSDATPTLFYIDENGYLRCFYASGTASDRAGASYVYEKSDETYVKVETLQRALGAFVTSLSQMSPSSLVSAVRFSNEVIGVSDFDKLVMLDWTNDPAESAAILALGRGGVGTTTSFDISDDGNGIPQYNYGLTGGTYTWTGLQAYIDHLAERETIANGTKHEGKKYIIIFTDGKDTEYEEKQVIEETEGYKLASSLKEDGYTIITVLLKGGTVVDGSDEYNDAKNFLLALSSDESLFYEASNADELTKLFTTDVISDISDRLKDYTVQDYIDPRFDLVDVDGTVWHLNAEGNVQKVFADGTTESVIVTEDGVEITLSNDSDVNNTARSATLLYDGTNEMYYLKWEEQTIPDCATMIDSFPVWTARFTIRAKEDFIGGNAVLTNGNEKDMNYVYSKHDQEKSSGVGDRWHDAEEEGEDYDAYPSKGFPRTTVNVKSPEIPEGEGKQLIYMGEDLNETDVAAIIIGILKDGGVEFYAEDEESALYLEYLERYYKYDEEAIAEAIRKLVETGELGLPYSYLPNESGTNLTGDAHEDDVLGTIIYKWTSDETYPNGVTTDTKTRVSTLTVTYAPKSVDDREGDNTALVSETEYKWNSHYKPAEGEEYGDIGPAEGEYKTEIVSGEIKLQMKLDADDIKYLHDNFTDIDSVTYQAKLYRTYNGETVLVGTFTAKYDVTDDLPTEDLTVMADFEYDDDFVKAFPNDCGLPIGDYTITPVTADTPIAFKSVHQVSYAGMDGLFETYEQTDENGKTPEDVEYYEAESDGTITIHLGTEDNVIDDNDYTDDRFALTQVEGDLGNKLEISKSVVGLVGDMEKAFGFTLKMELADAEESYTFHYRKTGNGEILDAGTITLTSDNGYTYSFELANGERLVITGIPAGAEFTVTEDTDEYFTTSVEVNGADAGTDNGEASVTIEEGASTVAFTNTRKTGDLTVSKVVVNGDSNRYFEFTVKFTAKDGVDIPEKITGVYSNGTSVTWTVTDGTVTFVLKDGESITISDLPAGLDYEVTETADNDYSAEVKDSDGNDDGCGTIIYDDEVTSAFTNTRIVRGDLAITKVVEGKDNDTDRTFTFEITLVDDDGPVSGKYSYTKTGYDESFEIEFDENGKGELELKHGETATIAALPGGAKFTVVELDHAGYDTTVIANADTIGDGTTAVVTVTNRYMTGSLRVEKLVTGTAGELDRYFEFTVEFAPNENGISVPETITGVYGDGSTVTLAVTDGKVTFELKHGESITLSDLPAGVTYVVTETDPEDDYTVSVNNGEVGVMSAEGEIDDEGTDVVTFNNHRDAKPTGSLRVRKTVTGNGGDTETEFTFRVKFTLNGEAFTEALDITIGNGGEADPENDVVTPDADGIVTITLKHDQWVLFTSILEGIEYSVTEVEADLDGYTTTATDAEGVIVEDVIAYAEFVNDKPGTGSLTVEKTVEGEDTDKAFSFTLTLRDADGNALSGEFSYEGKGGKENGVLTFGENGEASFTLSDGQSITVNGLPEGVTYTVAEAEDADYTVTVNGEDTNSASGTIEFNKDELVSVVNTKIPDDTTDIPVTGDYGSFGIWMMLAALSVLGMAVLTLMNKKRSTARGK